MPELVEAEVCATQLNVALWRATVVTATAPVSELAGWTVTGVVRAGNGVLFEFENPGVGARYMLSRFGSAARWRIDNAGDDEGKPCFVFSTPRDFLRLSFVTGRRASGHSVQVVTSLTGLEYMRFIATTHDVMSDRFDDAWLQVVFARLPPAMLVRSALARPEYFPGIGPWIANEALFRARLAPQRRLKELSAKDRAELVRAITLVVSNGVHRGGAALGAWRNPDGSAGKAQDDFCVHGRVGKPCLICGGRVARAPGGWAWCPSCQNA